MIPAKQLGCRFGALDQSKSSILSLGYGVMVTLQILVLSFLVRVRVSQLIR